MSRVLGGWKGAEKGFWNSWRASVRARLKSGRGRFGSAWALRGKRARGAWPRPSGRGRGGRRCKCRGLSHMQGGYHGKAQWCSAKRDCGWAAFVEIGGGLPLTPAVLSSGSRDWGRGQTASVAARPGRETQVPGPRPEAVAARRLESARAGGRLPEAGPGGSCLRGCAYPRTRGREPALGPASARAADEACETRDASAAHPRRNARVAGPGRRETRRRLVGGSRG